MAMSAGVPLAHSLQAYPVMHAAPFHALEKLLRCAEEQTLMTSMKQVKTEGEGTH